MATATFTVIINGPNGSVSVTPVSGLVAPVAAGTVLASVVIGPAGWSGVVSVDNPNMTVSGNFIVAASVLAAGNYTATVTVSP